MVFPVFFQKDFPKMMYRITSVDKVPLVEDMTIQQFEIWIIMIIQLNYHIKLSQLLEMFGNTLQNPIQLLQSPYQKKP